MCQYLQLIKSFLLLLCSLGLCLNTGLALQRDGSLRGQITDELGALIVGATVTLIAADGTQKTSVTNAEGNYTFNSLTPGRYIVRVAAPGFSSYEKTDVEVTARTRTSHNVQLVVGLEKQEITVSS
jgi:hypothetical protein